eukprot:GEMP01027666.1.p3 GENE.GEMP01027666.1~~GEMP01027666.1.p3  ORF type:complete len:152 (+),score=28.56 GEMP01027666.1:103-558(+)
MFTDELAQIFAWKIDKVVEVLVERLKVQCRYVANNGGNVTYFNCDHNDLEPVSSDTLVPAVIARAREIGLQAEDGDSGYDFFIDVSWPEDSNPVPRMGNLTGDCKICESKKMLVAMTPCGHMCCCSCAGQLKKTCPFCRTPFLSLQPLFKP